MASGEKKCRRKGNVLIVAVKLSRTSRELLTWTLAKFTEPGDHVIAVHVTSSVSQADTWRNNSDAANQQIDDIFDSAIGVYEGFCSIKKIDLQVKITNGPSVRKALTEEAKTCNAARLILGTTSSQISLGSSFSTAKYCAKRLPWTCSVLVMQHGRVVFEKHGSLVGNSRMQNAKQQPKRSQSCNLMGSQHARGKWANVLETSFDVQTEGCLVRYSSNEFDVAFHSWFLPSRYTDSPVSVLHSYKYVPPPLPSLRRFQSREEPNLISFSQLDTSRLQYQEETKILGPKKASIGIQSVGVHESPESCSHQNEPNHQCSQKDLQGYANSGWKSTSQDSYHTMKTEKSRKDVESRGSVAREALAGQKLERLDSCVHPGWPLLHQSISMSNSNSPRTKARGMSVVEWALQLPDRGKGLKQTTDFDATDDSSSLNKVTMCHDHFSESEKHKGGDIRGRLISANLNKTAIPYYADMPISVTEKPSLVCQNKSCRLFQHLELQAATNNFSKGNLVGEGGCSQVYRGELSDGRIIAVKCLNASATDSEQEFLTEIEIVNGLQHCHIVQLIGYCVDSQHYFLVYDFASEGNLEQKLHAGKAKTILPWNARYKIAVGVAEALEYLHNKCAPPVIHRDVKSSNVLLSSDLAPQLTDFGLAKWAPSTSTYITCSDVVGTFGYLAPEYFMYGKVNEKTDVYSFGVVLLELITGKHPIDIAKPRGQENLVAWSRPLLEDQSNYDQLVDPNLGGEYNADQLKILAIAAALCLRQSPQSRPRMSRILRLLTGECNNLEHLVRQDPICREIDEGFDIPNYGDCDIRSHLMLALVGLDDDVASQASLDHSMDLAHSNNLEEYLRSRYSRTTSFE